MTKQEYRDWEIMLQELKKQEEELDAASKTNYQELGQQYFEKMGDDIDPSFQGIVVQIKKNQEAISDLKERMDEVEKKLSEPVENNCPNCGKVMESTAKFCSECGTKLTDEIVSPAVQEKICKKCGKYLKPDAQFCGRCGSPV